MFYQYLIIPSILIFTIQGVLKAFYSEKIQNYMRIGLILLACISIFDLLRQTYSTWPLGPHFKVLFSFLVFLIPYHKFKFDLFSLLKIVLRLNVIIMLVEILIGLVSFYILENLELSKSFSSFFATYSDIESNNVGIYRKLARNIYLYRPSGLFGNIHLSSIALVFSLYINDKIKNKKELILIIATSILAGTIQSILACLVYLFFSKKPSYKRSIALTLSLLFLALFFYRIIDPDRFHMELSMNRILTELPFAIRQIPFRILIFGSDPAFAISYLDSQVFDSNGKPSLGLSDLAILRAIMTYGLFKLSLFLIPTFFWLYKLKQDPLKPKSFALILGIHVTILHYWMYESYIVMLIMSALIHFENNHIEGGFLTNKSQ